MKLNFNISKVAYSLINRTAESQSHCKDNQWFQNGYGQISNLGLPNYRIAVTRQGLSLRFSRNDLTLGY